MPHTYEYPRPALTVDCVVFGFEMEARFEDGGAITRHPTLWVLLVRRKDEPHKGKLALPGGFVNVEGNQIDKTIEAAARRELLEETGVEPDHLEQLYTFGDAGRDPRERVVSVAHMALVRAGFHHARAGSDAEDARWFPVDHVRGQPLAFDHHKILALAIERLRGKVRYTPIGFNLLPKAFSLGDLREVYEAILGREIDPSNFRKKIQATGVLRPAGKQKGVAHRPGALWQFDRAAYDRATKRGINFEV